MPHPLHFRFTRFRPRGFTLVELLTVIAIVGILSAIIIPVVGKVRASAQSSSCQSNLRQIWVATNLYATEHKFFPFSTSSTGVNWRQALRPYMDAGEATYADEKNSSAVVCPSRLIEPSASDYLRATYSCHPRLMGNPNLPGNPGSVRPSSVTRPAQIILYGDATQQSHGGSHGQFWSVSEMMSDGSVDAADTPIAVDVTTDSDPQGNGHIRYRHSGSMNAVFVDGHVTSFQRGTILNRNVRTNY